MRSEEDSTACKRVEASFERIRKYRTFCIELVLYNRQKKLMVFVAARMAYSHAADMTAAVSLPSEV
jgi:hypothetical protein